MTSSAPHRVVIAGGGVAGLEALIALHGLAGDLVATVLVTPDDEFLLRALSTEDPFARPAPRRYSVDGLCAAHGARHLRDRIASVDADARVMHTFAETELPYDSLLVATGARAVPVYPDVAAFRGLQDSDAMHGLLQDLEGGYSSSVAFVVPPGVTWPLPLYELALMTAERASGLGLDVDLTIVTPEAEPLAVFGAEASAAVARVLEDARITLVRGAHITSIEDGAVIGEGGELVARASRVMTVPRLEGRALPGVPSDPAGFLPIDEHGRVAEVRDVFAAGDGTDFPVKQGGIAAQQADAAARTIADRAGAFVVPEPFHPVLRARLLTGSGSKYLRQAAKAAGGAGSSASDHALWWPPSKVAAPSLSAYLDAVDEHGAAAAAAPHRPTGPIHAQGDPAGGIELLG
jgi:sulfide:quinone oxidoreductase